MENSIMTARIPSRRALTAVAAACSAGLLLSACGNQTADAKKENAGGSRSNAPLFDKLPADIRQAGVIKVGTDAQYAPMEYEEGGRIVGVDPDIAAELGKKLGVRFAFTSGSFDGLITALNSGRHDVVISSMSDTKARQQGLDEKGKKAGKGVDFVDYFVAGTAVYVEKGNPLGIKSIEDLCGRPTAVQRGTTFEKSVRTQSKACVKAAKPAIEIESFDTDAEAQTRVKSGGAVAGVNDYPVALDLSRKADGGKAFEVVGEQVDAGPFGIAVDKDNAQLRDALKAAVDAIIADGTYKEVLAKWDAASGAVTEATVNAGS
ncbi:ABC transporter substrate-binding protein [Streptomyces sp. NPDC005283]|uniref:ABC transporter substrate-binding protein n=1 Tax=Streptomyces sp. NPDC005283 TaxID=3156871 RepID=UPI00345122A0